MRLTKSEEDCPQYSWVDHWVVGWLKPWFSVKNASGGSKLSSKGPGPILLCEHMPLASGFTGLSANMSCTSSHSPHRGNLGEGEGSCF